MRKNILKWGSILYENDVIRYVFFGGCTTLVNLISFYVLRKAGLALQLANLISIILAILFAYVVNSRYVFRNHCETIVEHLAAFLKFIGARLLTMGVEIGGVWLLVEKLQFPDMAGKGLTQVVVLVLNYLFSKFLIFTHQKKTVKTH